MTGSSYTVLNGTISANLVGSGIKLTKTGTGSVTLNGNNGYTNTTTIGQGTLVIGSKSNLPATSAIFLGDGSHQGVLSYTGSTDTLPNTITLNAPGGEIDVTNSGKTLTITVAGGYPLTKGGAGIPCVYGSSSNSGNATISQGTLNVSDLARVGNSVVLGDALHCGVLSYSGATNTSPYSGGITVNPGGGEIDVTTQGNTLTIGGNINTSGVLTFGGDGNTLVSGVISGSGSIIKAAGGILTLTGQNTYAGGTTICNNGLIVVGNSGTAGTLGIGAVSDYGSLVFNRSDSFTVANTITGPGSLTQEGPGCLNLADTGGCYIGALLVNSSGINGGLTLDDDFAAGKVVLLSGSIQGVNASLNSVPTLTVSDNCTLYSGTISVNLGGATTVTKISDGTVNLNGRDTYGGTTDIQRGSVVFAAAAYQSGYWHSDTHSSTADGQHSLGTVDNGSSATVAYTLYGDTDLNGTVNGGDLNAVLSNYNKTGMGWAQGDFDGNGTVNGGDLNVVLSNYNRVLTAASPAVTLMQHVGSANSNSKQLQFVVTFNQGVENVDARDFTVMKNGISQTTRLGRRLCSAAYLAAYLVVMNVVDPGNVYAEISGRLLRQQ